MVSRLLLAISKHSPVSYLLLCTIDCCKTLACHQTCVTSRYDSGRLTSRYITLMCIYFPRTLQ